MAEVSGGNIVVGKKTLVKVAALGVTLDWQVRFPRSCLFQSLQKQREVDLLYVTSSSRTGTGTINRFHVHLENSSVCRYLSLDRAVMLVAGTIGLFSMRRDIPVQALAYA